MKGFLIGLLYVVVGVVAAFGWMVCADSMDLLQRESDSAIQTMWPMAVFIMIAALHGYSAGKKQARAAGG